MESTNDVDQQQRRPARSQGRPRDTRIDDAVLRATVELLEEIGYTRLTIPLVAARAGSTPPAVYRRFPTKIDLVYEAVFPTLATLELPLAGDLESGVRALVRASIDLFSRRAVHSAISGLMAEMPSEQGLSARLLGRLQDNTYVRLQQFLDNAAAEGLAANNIDARLFLDMISGTVTMALANERDLDDAWVEQATALIMKGVAR
jgi:AcrR family transcriptional regulator